MDWLQDAWNQDGGKKRQAEEHRQMRLERAKAEREQRMQDEGGGFGENPHLAFAMDTAQQGMANHAAAAGAINSAINDEMDSRVAQEREARRMEHEKYLANMRVQMAQKEQEGQMIRSLLNG